MAGEKDNVVEAPDFLSMSDEDMANFDPSKLGEVVIQSNNDADLSELDEGNDTQDDVADDSAADDDQKDDVGNDKGADDDSKSEDKDDPEANDSDDAANAKGDADQKAPTDKSKVDPAKAGTKDSGKEPTVKDGGDDKAKSGVEDAKDESGVIDYKAAYEKLTAPFAANGRNITVKSVDDAISLMQMGANYNKKMAGLKPNLKLLKMLESADLLSEDKLNFLIDVSRKDPAAINKLVKDSGIDPLDLSAEKADGYQPGKHGVTDQEMELDNVLSELKDSEHYTRTLDVVAREWDQASKAVVTQSPQILGVINGHMQTGIYDIIKAEIDSERVFGRLKGLSDLEAYRQVGDAIQARGGFHHLSGHIQKEKTSAPAVVKPKPKQADEDVRKEKKRAAALPKTGAVTKTLPADFNPLGLSDEDFGKFKPI